jgi:hypothetical protein
VLAVVVTVELDIGVVVTAVTVIVDVVGAVTIRA